MRIGIDARTLTRQRTGIANFLQGMIQSLIRHDRTHEFVLYARRPIDLDLPRPSWRTRVVPGLRGVNNLVWLQLYGKSLAERDGVDVFWGPHYMVPVALSRRIATVVTVHDLVHLLFPQTMKIGNFVSMKLLLRPSLWRAQRVTADSHTTAADLSRRMRVPMDKISVVTPGVAPQFFPRDPDEARRRTAALFGLPGPYLLTVATLEPRKNLTTMIRAFQSLPSSARRTWPLVVAGASGWRNSAIHDQARPLLDEGTVRFLGYVDDAELPWLYAGAALFLFPSLYEGFGIPLVEAMASSVPVIASDIPVAREVAAEAAAFVAPTDTQAWAEAIQAMLQDEGNRAKVQQAGLRRASAFSYDASARRLVGIFEQLSPAHRG